MFARILLVIASLFSVTYPAHADSLANQINDRFYDCMGSEWIQQIKSWSSPGKFAECKGQGYEVLFEASKISNQLSDKPHRWIPIKGKATVSDYFILVQFMLDDEMINFFKTKFLDSNTRLPIGLEIDVSPINSDVFRESGEVVGLKLPNDAGLFLDTSKFDNHPSYGAVIRNPHKLNANEPYAIVFYAKGAPWYNPSQDTKLVQGSGEVRLSFQVSVEDSLVKQMIASYDAGDHTLNGYSSDGSGGGFDYFVVQSDGFSSLDVPSHRLICWSDKGSDSVDCSNGNPFHDNAAENVVSSGGAVSQSSVSSGEAILSAGDVVIPGKGPGGASTVTDTSVELLPDFVATHAWLETPFGFEAYQYGSPEIMKMKAQFENIGDGNLSSGSTPIEVHFYLSKGYKEDPHSGDGAWKRVGTDYIQPENLRVGDTHTETEGIELWRDIPSPGIWNIVACVDHIRDDHNNGGDHEEKHESNNCSTEAVFEVTADGQVVNIPWVDFVTSSLQFLQTPRYAGDQVRFGAYVTNQGTAGPSAGIRSSYTVECSGTGSVLLADDGTEASEFSPGASAWEETLAPVTLPNVSGACTATFCADYQGAVSETDESNNCTSLSFTLEPRPEPKLVITRFEDEKGCCTSNTGSRIEPNIWVRNDGPVAPGSNVPVIYHISSPVATGGGFWHIGSGIIEPRELPPGGTDEDYMDGNGWPIPNSSAWKKQWHTVRGCLKADGSTPVGDPSTEVCAYYTRYSKK